MRPYSLATFTELQAPVISQEHNHTNLLSETFKEMLIADCSVGTHTAFQGAHFDLGVVSRPLRNLLTTLGVHTSPCKTPPLHRS